MTTVISGGLVSIEDGTKKAEDYAPARKVRVELRFDIPEDGSIEVVLDAVAALADRKVRELLGKEVVPNATTITPAAPAPVEEPAAAKPASRRGPKAKTEMPEPGSKADLEAKAIAAAGGKPAADPDVLDGGASDTPIADAMHAANEAAQADPLAGLEDAPEKPKEITDADLNHMVSEHIKQLGAKPGDPRYAEVRKIMQSFIGEGQPIVLRGIPQAKRGAFLEELKGIK